MQKHTITFKDLDGNPLTEDFYFHINKAELAKMQISKKGGVGEVFKQLTDANDSDQVLEVFDEVILMSYGIRLDDNVTFDKENQVGQKFIQTDAYSELFLELFADVDKNGKANDGTAIVTFLKGIFPEDISAQIDIDNLPVQSVTSVETVRERPQPQDHRLKQVKEISPPEKKADPSREELEAQLAKMKHDEQLH